MAQQPKIIQLPFPKTCPHCQSENRASASVRQVGSGLWFNCQDCGQALLLASVDGAKNELTKEAASF